MSAIKAIVWKEYAILCTNKKGLFLMMLGYIAFIGIFIWAKISTKGFQIEEFESNINYATLTVSYMIFISSLKFWQEKSMQTLEVLFMLPTSIIGIIMAKTIVPICISQISVVSFYFIANGVCMIITGQGCGSTVMLLQIVFISTLFEILYSIINCYAMWCASLTYAKFIQMVSVILYLGSVFSIMLTPVKLNFLNSPGVWGVIIIMSIYSLRCLKKITKERAINTLQY